MKIIRGKQPSAKKIVVYGPEGIGKSTFASRFPDPVFIDTEGSTKDMDVARFEAPSSWQMILEQVRYVKAHPEICRTLVLDTADWAEMRCIDHICARYHKDGLEELWKRIHLRAGGIRPAAEPAGGSCGAGDPCGDDGPREDAQV